MLLPSLALFLALATTPTAAELLKTPRLHLLATTANSTSSNSTLLPAVCTPDECLVGANSLTAGVAVSSSVNGSTQLISLLPGTYTSSSSAFTSAANSTTSSLSSALFSKKASPSMSTGFTSSGSLSSSSSSTYTVSLLPGLTAYSSSLYQGTASHVALPANYSSANSTTKTSDISSLLLSSASYAIVTLESSSIRLVLWDSVSDVGELKNGAGSGGLSIVDVQGSGCTTQCASGGVCTGNGTCACAAGWTGQTCNSCSTGYFGKSCTASPTGCKDCDDGLTGSGLCLDVVATNITLPSTCDCYNGECASNSTTATCTCNAGWTKASNGTQCATCDNGYYMTSGGDCLACDPSCASCSPSTGTCITCQSGLQPLSTDATKCVTATTALTNGTFITCASRTFFSSSANACVDCNPLCESCYKTGTDGCLACRTPNVLLDGQCVAMDDDTGVCDKAAATNSTAAASGGGFVYDNTKEVCDALPQLCTAGNIKNFTSTSTRSQLACTACISGAFLVNGACVPSCPSGTMESADGESCQECDSSCASCSTSSSYCTSCTSSSSLVLNGTCLTSSSCPTGYFPSTTAPLSLPNATTCLACHPDCSTCSTSVDVCTSCPSSRPVLTSSGTCVPTCSSNEYYDTVKSLCETCDSGCATCSKNGSDACLSCASGSRLSSGKCVAADDCATWVNGFGVCLSDLVTVSATSAATEKTEETKWTMPWWLILVIVLSVLATLGGGFWWFRRKEKKRRKAQTAKFANELGNKEVTKKLAALPISISRPSIPIVPPSPSSPSHPSHLNDNLTYSIPLTPRFATSHHQQPPSPALSKSSYAPSEVAPLSRARQFVQSRWSSTSSNLVPQQPALRPQQTGASTLSSTSVLPTHVPHERMFTTKAGNTLVLNGASSGGGGGGSGGQSRNPFLNRMI